jgi:uncharacterized protein
MAGAWESGASARLAYDAHRFKIGGVMTKLFGILTMAAFVVALTPVNSVAQTKPDPIGRWAGALEVRGEQLEIRVELKRGSDGSLKGTIDVPAQGLSEFPLSGLTVEAGSITFAMAGVPGNPVFKGAFSEDASTITGELSQGGVTVPFKLQRKPVAVTPGDSGDNKQGGHGIEGNWQGLVRAGGLEHRVILRVTRTADGALVAKMDSPDQGATDLPVSSISQNGDAVSFEMKSIGGSYTGTLSHDGAEITGKWSQGGATIALDLKRGGVVTPISRPQEPKKPYPYVEEEVTYENKAAAGVTLAGTLTVPKGTGPFAAVLLISGSGPQDRNETIVGHKPFLVLADWLTRKGIAVLRVDDRGVSKSTGNFLKATTEDFASDALAGVEYLKGRNEIDPGRIGLVGHSEGGLIAPMVAVKSRDVSFIVMMAGPGLTGEEILFLQSALIARAGGASVESIERDHTTSERVFEVVKNESDPAVVQKKVREIFSERTAGLTEQAMSAASGAIEGQIRMVTSPWFKYFLTYDPRPALRKLRCPVMAINGELDLQVPPKENLPEIAAALADNPDYSIVKLPGLNHLFQTCKTGAVSEYARISETISPAALEAISAWIVDHTAKH